MPVYITRTCILQGRSNDQEEWRTLDMIDSNRQNDVDRSFLPVSVRYVRLYVVSPTQAVGCHPHLRVRPVVMKSKQ